MTRIKIEANTNKLNRPTTTVKSNKTLELISGALFTLLTPAAVLAAPPVAYDGWTVTGGIIDTSSSCGTLGVTCRELAPAEAGFKYEEVTSDGSKFLRLILTDETATGDAQVTGAGALDFANESFIPFALINIGIAQGVASKLAIRDSASNLEVVAEIQKGNMRSLYATAAEDLFTTKLSQTLSPSTDFSSTFNFTNYTAFSTNSGSNNPDTSTEIGRKLEISQDTLVGNVGDTTKKQTFVQRQASGFAGNTVAAPWPGSPPGLKTKFLLNGTTYFIRSAITNASSLTLPDTANGQLASPAASNTVSWTAAQDISTTWVAQSSNSPSNPVGTGINYQRVKNNTTGIEASATLLELLPATADPFAWDANFGAAPPSL